MSYTEEELFLIEQYKDLPKKQCKECKKELPVNEVFFMKEKRIKDGFENKCRKCRTGNYLNRKGKDAPPSINNEILDKFKSVPEMYEYMIKTNSMPYRSFVLDNHLEIFKYLVSKENIHINELNTMNRKWFQDRKLYSSLLRIYNGNIFQFVNAAYPNVFNPWDFVTVGNVYWKDKENRIKALQWFVNKLIEDNVINTIEEIPKKITGEHFKDYSLISLLVEYYNYHVYYAFNDLYPNKFYIWQYHQTPNGYFDNKENRIKSFKELAEDYLQLNIKDVPKVFSYEYINLSYEDDYIKRFKSVIDKYYKNINEYIMEVYPNVFTNEDFPYKNHYTTLDNIIVRSEPERMLHHLFMRLNINYTYGEELERMKIQGVTVIPDWYIYSNDKIILVEYYGMLDMYAVDYGYKDKYQQKEQLCKDNSNRYLPLYVDDMRNNFQGVKDKLIKYSII